MRIVFIKPNMIVGTPGDSMEPLVFAILSALTPSRIERCLYDERIEPIDFEAPADLVAITVDVFTAKRAYQIADRYLKVGIPVVMGGFHPTLCPDEAAQYADSIVIGDAEDTWPLVLQDAENKALKPKYVSSFLPIGEVEPDRAIFQGKSYAPVSLVEFKRGCRFSCDFCSIHAMYRGQIRHKSLKSVFRDIDRNSRKYLFFTDDNFYADIPSLTAILHELATRRLKWACQISADIIKHPELVPLMAKAGCVVALIGFESLDRDNLLQMRKGWALDDYRRIIRLFNDHGIMVYGTFIIGYDHDTIDTFERTLDFALENKLFLANFNPLFPTPGTPLYVRIQEEGRLLFERWWLDDRYRWGDSVFRPMRMTPEEMAAGCYRVREKFNSTRSILARFPGLSYRQTDLTKAGLFLNANFSSRRELYRKYGQPLGDGSSG